MSSKSSEPHIIERRENVLRDIAVMGDVSVTAIDHYLYEIKIEDDTRSTASIVSMLDKEMMTIKDIGFAQNNIIVTIL